ncbi:hypothetical protein LCGC14_1805000 [marine sediment metagenome]|uniref:Uncharacterized protein n=1 Tax=marine sediment metagenome TaxID=412755 RepID=A0A0F9GNE7_9ZZZZ
MAEEYFYPATAKCPACMGTLYQHPPITGFGYDGRLRLFVHKIERHCKEQVFQAVRHSTRRPRATPPDLSKLQQPR